VLYRVGLRVPSGSDRCCSRGSLSFRNFLGLDLGLDFFGFASEFCILNAN